MAEFKIRTIEEIYQQLLADKSTFETLDGLEITPSKSADWELWLEDVASATYVTDIASNVAITDIQNLFNNQILYTPGWYIQTAKEFQYPGSITKDPITNRYRYETIDTSKQIISSCTTKESANKVKLKVRSKNNAGILLEDEKISFESYINKVKELGQQIEVINLAPDQVTLNMTILYKGDLSLADVKIEVENTINNYIVNLNFDSAFYTNQLIDALQKLSSVVDPRLDSASALNSNNINIPFTYEYESMAGYMIINTLTPLANTINYIAR